MKKQINVALFTILLAAAAGNSVAQAAIGSLPGNVMRFDARDSLNRQVSAPSAGFEETTFSRFYTMFSPVGVTRWRGSSSDGTSFGSDSRISIPHVTAAIVVSERNIFPGRTERYTYSLIFPGISFLMSLAVLTFKPRLQTLNEPRFLIPVFLE